MNARVAQCKQTKDPNGGQSGAFVRRNTGIDSCGGGELTWGHK